MIEFLGMVIIFHFLIERKKEWMEDHSCMENCIDCGGSAWRFLYSVFPVWIYYRKKPGRKVV
ncbi:hypothetical protein [Sellimonas intestinalis]|uniref:hypothetical protein n=1 Tax=Sellimonas intestinalis TaxID=1653434 RepID=UPI003990CB4D